MWDKVKDLLDDNFDIIVDDLNVLEFKDCVSVYLKLLEFSLLKLKSIEVKVSYELI